MAELREYRVTLNGVDSTMLLSDKDAKRMGAVPIEAMPAAEAVPVAKSRPVLTTSRAPHNKGV